MLWEASDRICGKRLKALMPILVEAMERHGHLRLGPEIRAARMLADRRPASGAFPTRRRPNSGSIASLRETATSACGDCIVTAIAWHQPILTRRLSGKFLFVFFRTANALSPFSPKSHSHCNARALTEFGAAPPPSFGARDTAPARSS